MPIPINPNVPFDYVLKEELDAFKKGEPVTVWKLKPMTLAERQMLEKSAIGAGSRAMAGNKVKVDSEAAADLVAVGHQRLAEKSKIEAINLVRTHLMGWEGFAYPETGEEVPCNVPGSLDASTLEIIYPWIEELAEAIITNSRINRTDREKSSLGS